MLDVTHDHPFAACVAFAVRWLGAISRYDLAAAKALIDVNDSGIPFEQSFPAPEGFTYCHPEKATGWSVHFTSLRRGGYSVDFAVPFVERKYREMIAIFEMMQIGSQLEVRFVGLKPS